MSKKKLLLSLLAFLVMLISGCAATEAKPTEDKNILREPVEIIYPQSLGDFTLVKDENNEDPVVGHALSYESEFHNDLVVTVYAYFHGLFPSEDAAIEAQSKQLLLDFKAAEEANLYTVSDTLSSEIVTLDTNGKSLSGYRHFFKLTTPKGANMLSVADVYFLPPYFIKVRASFPTIGNLSYEQKIQNFEELLLSQLKVSERVRCEKQVIVTSADDGNEWVSVEGRLLAMDLTEDKTQPEAEPTIIDIMETPLLVAMQRQNQRTIGCE